MIGYREIITVAVFMAVVVIIILWLIVKKAKEKKIEEIKDRKLRGEDVEKEKELSQWSFFKWFNNTTQPLFPVVVPILAYIVVLVSFSILLPDLWQKYWGRQEFFWISQVYLVVMVILGRLEGFWLKWMPRILFSVILFLYVLEEWPKPKNNSNIVAKTDITTTRGDPNTNVRTVEVVTCPDKWVKVKIPSGYDWQFDSDPAYGLENVKTLVAVRINGDEKSIKYSGMLHGLMSNAFFEKQASYVEFKSEDKNAAYLLMHLRKK